MVKRIVKRKKERVIKRTEVPFPVKILSVLYYIFCVFVILAGIGLMFGSAILEGFASYIPLAEYSEWIALFVFGVFLILLGIFMFFIAQGLWTGKNWARIVAIIFTTFGAFGALTDGSFFSFLVDAIIVIYLWFNEDVKRAFR